MQKLKKSKQIFYYFNLDEVKAFLSKSSPIPLYREETKGKIYNNGGIYSGELRGGFRDGVGIMQ